MEDFITKFEESELQNGEKFVVHYTFMRPTKVIGNIFLNNIFYIDLEKQPMDIIVNNIMEGKFANNIDITKVNSSLTCCQNIAIFYPEKIPEFIQNLEKELIIAKKMFPDRINIEYGHEILEGMKNIEFEKYKDYIIFMDIYDKRLTKSYSQINMNNSNFGKFLSIGDLTEFTTGELTIDYDKCTTITSASFKTLPFAISNYMFYPAEPFNMTINQRETKISFVSYDRNNDTRIIMDITLGPDNLFANREDFLRFNNFINYFVKSKEMTDKYGEEWKKFDGEDRCTVFLTLKDITLSFSENCDSDMRRFISESIYKAINLLITGDINNIESYTLSNIVEDKMFLYEDSVKFEYKFNNQLMLSPIHGK